MASKAQEEAWLKLFEDPQAHVLRRRQLKSWLFAALTDVPQDKEGSWAEMNAVYNVSSPDHRQSGLGHLDLLRGHARSRTQRRPGRTVRALRHGMRPTPMDRRARRP